MLLYIGAVRGQRCRWRRRDVLGGGARRFLFGGASLEHADGERRRPCDDMKPPRPTRLSRFFSDALSDATLDSPILATLGIRPSACAQKPRRSVRRSDCCRAYREGQAVAGKNK